MKSTTSRKLDKERLSQFQGRQEAPVPSQPRDISHNTQSQPVSKPTAVSTPTRFFQSISHIKEEYKSGATRSRALVRSQCNSLVTHSEGLYHRLCLHLPDHFCPMDGFSSGHRNPQKYNNPMFSIDLSCFP